MSGNLNNNNSNDFVIGEGFEISEESTSTAKLKKQKKKSSKKLIIISMVVVISLSLALGAIFAGADYLGMGFGRGDEVEINIEIGSSTSQIANQLKDSGAVKIPFLFRIYSKIKGYDGQFKYGVYTFNSNIGYEEIAEKLINEGAKAETLRVTIPEGTGINDYIKNVNGEKITVPGIATILEKAGVCTKTDFLNALNEVQFDTKLLKNANVENAYYALEGYLFPETYEFFVADSKESAKLVIEKMIKETEKRITDDMYKKADELGYSMNEILTMASIIQMESGKYSTEMSNVAAVFYNRLKATETGGALGSSPTLYYGDSFEQDDGRYNTQADNQFSAIKGLPPGPLCSPGIDAIKAALYPTENFPYFYFVTDKNGKFYYHKTISEQNVTINKLKQGNNWIYEYY